jgi:hypothetical protein
MLSQAPSVKPHPRLGLPLPEMLRSDQIRLMRRFGFGPGRSVAVITEAGA